MPTTNDLFGLSDNTQGAVQSATGAGDTTGIFPALTQQQQPQDLFATPFSQMGAYGKIATVGQGLGAFSSLANIYAGFKAMKLQKQQFQFQKDAFNKNYNAQVKDYENTLKQRWAARSNSAAARGGSFESMSSYVGSRALAPSDGG